MNKLKFKEYKESNGLNKLLKLYPIVKEINTKSLGLKNITIEVSKTITFILTRSCNKSCSHCLAKVNKNINDFDIEKFETIVSQLREKGVEFLIISGGEPFMYFDSFGDIFDILHKNGMKIYSLKTNLYRANDNDYVEKFLNFVKSRECLFIHGIETSFDIYHGEGDFKKLKKVIDINSQIIQNPSFEEKKFMNIAISRMTFEQDFQQVKKLIEFLFQNYKVKLLKNDLKDYLNEKKEILNYIWGNISIDYFLLEIENKKGKILKIRIGLNDVYKIGKGENIQSNLKEKSIQQVSILDLHRYLSLEILGVDIDGNVFLDEFSTYTGRGVIGNIFKKPLREIIKDKEGDVILYELYHYGLKRLLPRLRVLYPELENLKYTIYDDIWQKILTLPEIEKVLKVLCVGLNLSKNN